MTLEALSLLVLSFSSLLSFSSFSLSLSRKEKIVALVEYEAGGFFFFATVALQRNPFFFLSGLFGPFGLQNSPH